MAEGTRRSLRRLGAIAVVIGAFAAFAPLASADLSGIVDDARRDSRSTTSTSARWTRTASAPAATTPTRPATTASTSRRSTPPAFPLTVTYEYNDPCQSYSCRPLTTTQVATANPRRCLRSRSARSSSARIVVQLRQRGGALERLRRPASGRVLSPSAASAYLRLPIPSNATGLTVLFNGARDRRLHRHRLQRLLRAGHGSGGRRLGNADGRLHR